jgi:uncharacterized membrane protein YccC
MNACQHSRSSAATTDYLVGTLGGAIYAGAIGALVPHENEMALLAALALAIAPAALVVAINPRYSAATFTAVMVFFGPAITHTGPIASAVERVIEVAVGGIVGLFVSLVVFPARAHDLAPAASHGRRRRLKATVRRRQPRKAPQSRHPAAPAGYRH